MNEENYHFSMEDLLAIEVRLGNKTDFDLMVKNFSYNDNASLSQNLTCLATKVVDFLKLEGKVSEVFQNYFIQKNIPIEVTFKPLKPEQLQNIIEDWISIYTENSTIKERLYSNNHRNILFKRVLFDQKDVINDYFQTLSEKSMLKAVDLYQLLVQILTPYHLYEYQADSETFFEKVNSFNTFLGIVEKFVNSEKRISYGINRGDIQYVRRFQFERLIEFWESLNSQLLLLSDRRKNLIEVSTQTNLINMKQRQIQTQKIQMTLSEIISNTLVSLNKITLLNNNVHELQSIERIYSLLRREKISILHHKEENHQESFLSQLSEKTEKLSPKSRQIKITSSKYVQEFTLSPINKILVNGTSNIGQPKNTLHIQKLTSKQPFFQYMAKPTMNTKLKQVLFNLFNQYNKIEGLNMNILLKCLIQLGVIEQNYNINIHQTSFKKYFKDYNHISQNEFIFFFENLMIDDHQLTIEVLEQFLIARQNLKKNHIQIPQLRQKSGIQREGKLSRNRSYLGKYLEYTKYY